MLHLLLALGAATTPVSAEAAPVRCVPDKVTRCHQSARPQANYELPVGKRCNPDPTKAVGCRERLRASDVPR